MKKLSFVFNKQIINVNHQITNNKNMYIKVRKDNSILVTSPNHISEEKIKQFMLKNLEKVLIYIKNINNTFYSLKDKFIYYQGKKFDIVFLTGFLKSKIKVKGNKFYIMTKEALNSECKKSIKEFFKKEIFKYLNDKQLYFENKMEVPRHKIKISYKFSNWAVNNINLKSISYSSRLMHFSFNVIDYIIVHELAHYFEHNHSKFFYKIINKYIPNYKSLEKSLKVIKKLKME